MMVFCFCYLRAKVAHGVLSGKYSTTPQEPQGTTELQTDQVVNENF